jgi:serine/threonine protein kinase
VLIRFVTRVNRRTEAAARLIWCPTRGLLAALNRMSRHGTQLGPYTLHEEINTGGMSEIWLGTDAAGKAVAIRLMLNNSTFAFTERKRFLTGCETLQACQDGNHIIGYVEHGKIGGELMLVLEYVEGENLKLRMATGDPVLAENIAQVLIDFAEALEVVSPRRIVTIEGVYRTVIGCALERVLALGSVDTVGHVIDE